MAQGRALSFANPAFAKISHLAYSVSSNRHQTKAGFVAEEASPKGSLLEDLISILKKNVLYENRKIICLNKPAGVHGYGTKTLIGEGFTTQYLKYIPVENVLHQLAKDLNCGSLRVCHSPHPLYSGAMILAKTDAVALTVRSLFKLAKRQNEYRKTDLALTIGIPSPRSGLIKIPIQKREIHGKIQALPVFNAGTAKTKKKEVKRRRTLYSVLEASHGMALVELQSRDGLGQQSLLHITCKLCQVLGDKEFSNRIVKVNGVRMLLDDNEVDIGTQKLAPRITQLLGLHKHDVQNLPLFVHRWKISLPQNCELDIPEDITISVPLPHYFSNMLQHLGMSDPST